MKCSINCPNWFCLGVLRWRREDQDGRSVIQYISCLHSILFFSEDGRGKRTVTRGTWGGSWAMAWWSTTLEFCCCFDALQFHYQLNSHGIVQTSRMVCRPRCWGDIEWIGVNTVNHHHVFKIKISGNPRLHPQPPTPCLSPNSSGSMANPFPVKSSSFCQ